MASKLTDTELTVGTDGHKVTGVDADGKALTSGSDLTAKVNELQVEQTGIEPDWSLTYSERAVHGSVYKRYLKSSKIDLPKKSLSDAIKFLAQYTSHMIITNETCTCDCHGYCSNNDHRND